MSVVFKLRKYPITLNFSYLYYKKSFGRANERTDGICPVACAKYRGAQANRYAVRVGGPQGRHACEAAMTEYKKKKVNQGTVLIEIKIILYTGLVKRSFPICLYLLICFTQPI